MSPQTPFSVSRLGELLLHVLPHGSSVRLDGRHRRLDAAVASAFVAQELEYLKSQTFDITKVALRARDFIPVSNETHPGAEVVAYDQYDSFGEAAVVENYATDFPRVDAEKQRFRDAIVSLGDSYGYSVQDLRAIAMTGSRLNDARAMQARRGQEAKLEKVATVGLPKIGKTGMLNDANVDLFATALAWDMTTPASTIKRDLGAIVQSIVVNSSQVWAPDTLLLPTSAFAIASEVSFGTDNPEPVLSVFLRTNPYIRMIDQWVALDGAGAGGADRIVAYKRDKSVLELEIPQDYEEMPPEVRGMEFLVHTHMRTAGTAIRYPMAMQYADGTFDVSDITP